MYVSVDCSRKIYVYSQPILCSAGSNTIVIDLKDVAGGVL
jgi:hypothetical protein